MQDIAITLSERNSVAILVGKRGGTYVEAGVYSVGEVPYKLASADLNGDTFPDLAVANLSSTDVSIVPEAAVGDRVCVIGRQGDAAVWADELGGWCETISYEMLTAVVRRVPRVVMEDFDG